jgi:ABC-2 type transport system permease protein
MIGTILRIGWINVSRDRVVQALTFLLPIMFFSIFASIFSSQSSNTPRVRVAVADEDGSEYSKKLVAALKAEAGLRVRFAADTEDVGAPLNRASAEALVKAGTVPVAIVFPKGLGASPHLFGPKDQGSPRVELLADVSDQVAAQTVLGLLQKVSFTAAPEALATEGMSMFERYAGPLTPGQQQARDRWLSEIKPAPEASSAASAAATGVGLDIKMTNVMQPGSGNAATVSFYAAGVGVMFLLFSCSGAGGAMIEEEEAGTLGRLVGSKLGMRGVLAGKWLFVATMGFAQLTVMFLWGALVFHLPLASHIPGFVVMTFFTAAAASGFGLLLATLSRSRAQLSGLSTIIILTMSAIGGSMFPRFLMSETMQKIGLVTFNAWALDGYLKVFWREAPIFDLWPQVLVLSGLTVVFLAGARVMARRWETL